MPKTSLILVTFFSLTHPAYPGDWPLFRGDRQMTGTTSENMEHQPKPVWKFATQSPVESTPVIAGQSVYFASVEGYFYAINLTDGKERWRFKSEAQIKSSPGYHQGRVFFGNEQGKFLCLNAETGSKAWEFEAMDSIVSAPNFYNDFVLFGSYDNALYCLNWKTGQKIWAVETNGYLHAAPAIAGDRVFISGCDGFFRGIQIATGAEDYEIELGGYVAATPAFDGTYFFMGTFEADFHAVDPKNGKIVWTYRNPAAQFPFYASAAVGNNMVFVGGRDKTAYGFLRDSAQPKWQYPAKSKLESSPVLAGSTVIFASERGVIFALDSMNGTLRWSFELGIPITSSLAIADGCLLLGTRTSGLICLKP